MHRGLPKEPSKDQPTVNTFMSSEPSPSDPKKMKQRSGDSVSLHPSKKSAKSNNQESNKSKSILVPNKKITKITKKIKMSTINPNDSVNSETLQEDLIVMEARMTTNITTSLKSVINEEMKEIKENNTKMDSNMNTAIDNMNQAVTRLIESNQTFLDQKSTIRELQTENKILSTPVHRLENEHSKLKFKLNQMENKTLECSIIIKGIPETIGESKQDMIDVVHWELSNTILGNSDRDRYEKARRMEIHKCKRIGKFNQERSRPISVEFLSRQDSTYVLTNRSWLREGIYVEREYSLETERKRKLLRPIVKASKNLSEFKGKVHLKDDTVVVRGKTITTKTLHKLPEELNVFNITSRSNDTTLGFFGELNPLSNFHPASFVFNDVHYTTSEQFIQHQKALCFGDHQSATRIITTESPVDCKAIGTDIMNFNQD